MPVSVAQTRAKGEPNHRKKSSGMSWATFQRTYLSREDGFKYEWVNGKVEKTPRDLDYHQFFILTNLLAFFRSLIVSGKADGELIAEGDIFFRHIHRRPDVAWFSAEQIARTAHGQNQVPQFVVEIISKTDTAEKVSEKLQNYRDAGVPVVWYVYPKLEEVHEHRGLTTTVHRGDDLCSAAPTLPAFELPVSAVFKKPPLPETTP